MGQDVPVIVRFEKPLKRQLHLAKKQTGMTIKAILSESFRQWLERRKRASGAE